MSEKQSYQQSYAPQAGYAPQQQQGYPPQQQQQQGYPPQAPPPGQSAVPRYEGEMPSDDVLENSNAQAPSAAAPSMGEFQGVVKGYEQAGFDGSDVPPPSYEESMQPPPRTDQLAPPRMFTEEEVRTAIIAHAKAKCCWGTKAAETMVINSIDPSTAYHYELVTFSEARSTAWKYEPYHMQPIDGPENGYAPGPWDIVVEPSAMFRNESKAVEVPHTAVVKTCHNCYGRCYIRCWTCHGRGRVRCGTCSGSGRVTRSVTQNGQTRQERQSCYSCAGNGRRTCFRCCGCGQVSCDVCNARGSLKWYIRLTVKFKTTPAHHVTESTGLPAHLVTTAKGDVLFEDENVRVWPVTHFPQPAVNAASDRMVTEAVAKFASERILRQRQSIRGVPIAEVSAVYKQGPIQVFWVYGHGHSVHAPQYPQKVCWGCTIV